MTGVIIDHMAVRVSSPVLIGRSDEIGRLRASLQAAHEGHSSATLLAGEAGVGKTRVVAEIAAIAQAEGADRAGRRLHRPRRGLDAVRPGRRSPARARPPSRP